MQLALFMPPSAWEEPESLPDIPASIPVSVDLETKDDGLAKDQGAGWAWRGGRVVGVAVGWADRSIYLPVGHPDSKNLEPSRVGPWLHHVMVHASTVVFHNAPYDLGWLSTWGFRADDYRIDDTHAMAVLLDENRLSYSLDSLCKTYGLPGKDERLLREVAAALRVDAKQDLWKIPAKYVGPYAEQDAASTLKLYRHLKPLLAEQGLEEAYRLEIDLIPCCLSMRKRGIRLDLEEAQRVQRKLTGELEEIVSGIKRLAPPTAQPRSGDEFRSPKYLESLFSALQIPFGRTAKTGQGQFLSKVLAKSEHPIPRAIAKWRQLEDLRTKFIGTYILENSRAGRIHAEIHQLRDDDGGTRSYRFSYANPPLQQMPARDEGLAPLIRGIFLPEVDDLWLSADYSSQEPRLAVHFAAVAGLPGHEAAVEAYQSNPRTDFHQMVADLTGLPRSQAKIINLGVMYGMGVAKLAASLGVSVDEATGILAQYNARMPFIKELAEFCMRRADSRGFIRLLDGARCRWNRWQVGKQAPLSLEEAQAKQRSGAAEWQGQLRRAFTHKAMNRLVQGSAARQTKLAMRMAYQEGIMPLLQMHDELDFTIQTKAQADRAVEIMTHCVELRIPVLVDAEFGVSWGKSMVKGQNSWDQAYAQLKAA